MKRNFLVLISAMSLMASPLAFGEEAPPPAKGPDTQTSPGKKPPPVGQDQDQADAKNPYDDECKESDYEKGNSQPAKIKCDDIERMARDQQKQINAQLLNKIKFSNGNSCAKGNPNFEKEVLEACSIKQSEVDDYVKKIKANCSKMASGGKASATNPRAVLNTLGLPEWTQKLKAAASKCVQARKACSGCDNKTTLSAVPGTSFKGHTAYQMCQHEVGTLQADLQNGAKSFEDYLNNYAKNDRSEDNCSDQVGAGKDNYGDDPGDGYGNNEGEQTAGNGGGMDGLGQMLGQLLPLAMMAAMMNQDEDKPPTPKDKKVLDGEFKDFCAENPDSQVCQNTAELDCNNEEIAALNPQQCLCSDPAKARVTPICNPNGPTPTGNSGSYAMSDVPRNGLLGSSTLADLLGQGGSNIQAVEGPAPSVDANQKGGGGGGPRGGGGGSLGALGDNRGGGHAPGPYETDIMKGVGKGGGGGAAGGGGGYSYGGGSGDSGDDGEFDLKRFLPGKEPRRGIAGMAMKSTDGLTGPFGPSIWEKVSRRYRKMRPFLKR